MKNYLRWAVSLGAALFISMAMGAEKSSSKVQELFLQGKRAEALTALEGQNIPNAEKIKMANNISNTFLNESSQKKFETGLSLRWAEPQVSLARLQEALQQDPGNLLVQATIAQQLLLMGRCKEGLHQAEQALLANPYHRKAKVHKWENMICLGTFAEASLEIEKYSKTKPTEGQWFLKTQLARKKIIDGNVEEGLKALETITKEHSKYPEAWYWRWRLNPKEGKLQTKFAKSYVKTCEDLSPRKKRKFLRDSTVCLYRAEVEKYLGGLKKDEP